jgi:hypothetical protein
LFLAGAAKWLARKAARQDVMTRNLIKEFGNVAFGNGIVSEATAVDFARAVTNVVSPYRFKPGLLGS